MALPAPRAKIDTSDIDRALLEVARKARRAQESLDGVVGKRPRPPRDMTEEVRKLDRAMQGLSARINRTLSLGRSLATTRSPSGFAAGGFMRLVRSPIARFAGIITAAQFVADTAIRYEETRFENAEALNRSLVNAHLSQLRYGPNIAKNVHLKALEGSRMRNARQFADETVKMIETPIDKWLNDAGLSSSRAKEVSRLSLQSTDMKALARSLGYTEKQIDRISKQPTINTDVLNAKRELAKKYGLDVVAALGVGILRTAGVEVSDVQLRNMQDSLTETYLGPRDVNVLAGVLAQDRGKKQLQSAIRQRADADVIAANLVTTPTTGFLITQKRRRDEYLYGIFRPRSAPIARD